MTRRTLLAATGLFVTSLSVGVLLVRGRGRTLGPQQLEEEATRALRRLAGVSEADAVPLVVADWPSHEALDRLFSGVPPGALVSLLADDLALLRRLEELQRHDFEHGRVRFVDGWLLSETEVSVAALLRAPRQAP
jgi:hypothetical protein